jgi:hypothetical protein
MVEGRRRRQLFVAELWLSVREDEERISKSKGYRQTMAAKHFQIAIPCQPKENPNAKV